MIYCQIFSNFIEFGRIIFESFKVVLFYHSAIFIFKKTASVINHMMTSMIEIELKDFYFKLLYHLEISDFDCFYMN
jgi:hypothetical protein